MPLRCNIAALLVAWGTFAVPAAAQAETGTTVEADADHPVSSDIVVYGRSLSQVGVATTGSQGTVGYADFENRPISRIGELAENVPGLIATQHSGSGKANQYFLRGFNLDHGTDLAGFVDGVPVNMRSHGHGQGYLDLNFLIPELVEKIDYAKGPYHADTGDFASAGTLRFALRSRLVAPMAEISAGSFGYLRGLVAGSTGIGAGHLLGAVELAESNGPWTQPERERKFNALLRYAAADWSLGLSAYTNRWDSTDQVPERAIRSGLIPWNGNIDPALGGRSGRIQIAFNGHFGNTKVTNLAPGAPDKGHKNRAAGLPGVTDREKCAAISADGSASLSS